jgi:hypothetical protein
MSLRKNTGPRPKGIHMQRFIIRHPYLLMVIPIFFIVSPLSNPGIILTADFPVLDTSSYASGKLWVWTEKGSVPALETISRFPIIGAWYILSLVGISSELTSKFMIVLGFLLASFTFYLSFLLLFKNKVEANRRSYTRLKIAAIIGALFFAYNPWSFERIPHWYLWIGYAILPLFFIATVLAFRQPKKVKYIISTIFLWSFASTTPHMTVFYGIIFVSVFISFVLDNIAARIRRRRTEQVSAAGNAERLTIKLLIPFFSIFLLYILVNAYWIYPYVMSTQVRSISPNYLVTEENLELLSRESNFLNTFRLVANWQEQPFDMPEEGSSLYYVWYVASFALPIFGFSAIAISRKFVRYSSTFFCFLVIGIIIAMGTQSPIDYFKPIIDNPTLSKYVWLVRDPDKLSFVVAFTSSFLIGISSHRILELIAEKTEEGNEPRSKLRELVRGVRGYRRAFVSTLFLCLLVGSMCIYIYPVYIFNMFGELRPMTLPGEFDNLNSYLSSVNASKVYFIPYPLDETYWSKNNRVGNIYQTHSVLPSIESSGSISMAGMGSTNYYNHLTRSVIENRSNNIANFIHPLGTSYLIFHNDTWDKGSGTADKQNLELLERLNSHEGLRNVHNVGFYNIFKVDSKLDDSAIPGQFNIYGNDVAVLGGLEAMESLNGLYPSFNSSDTSLYFFDQGEDTSEPERIKNSEYILFGNSPSYYDLLFSLVNKSHIFTLFDTPINYEPKKLWSKASTMDPDSGYFHPFLEHLGIDNWQFDYDKGLAITQAMRTNLTMSFDVTQTGQYDLFMRYLESRKGGVLKIYLDNNFVGKINSLDEKSDSFVWQEVRNDNSTSILLKKGRHILTIENALGFNAINLVGILPTNTISNLEHEVSSMVNRTKDIYFIEAETGFKNNKGRSIQGNSSLHPPSLIHVSDDDIKMANFTFPRVSGADPNLNTTLTGQIRIPQNADLLSLYFLTQTQDNYYNQSYNTPESLNEIHKNPNFSIKSLRVYPAHESYDIYSSNFERKNQSVPLATLRKPVWLVDNENALSTIWDAHNPISGNSSLRVNIGQGNMSEWSTISTDLLPIDDKSYYGFNLDISARNVDQLHSKIIFFNESRERISHDFVSHGRDGTFEDVYSASIVPPFGAKYLRFEILTKPAAAVNTSYYLIDDMKFEEYTVMEGSFEEDDIESSHVLLSSPLTAFRTNEIMELIYDDVGFDKNQDLETEINDTQISSSRGSKYDATLKLSRDLGSSSMIIQKTKPISVRENNLYNYTVSFGESYSLGTMTNPENLKMYKGSYANPTVIAYFSNSSDVIDNSTKYGNDANNGNVLSLSPGAEIYTDFNIVKPSEYVIALRANGCDSCTFTIAIENKETNKIIKTEFISLNNTNDHEVDERGRINSERMRWLYMNESTYLNSGSYEMRIHSDSNAANYIDLDSVIVYSNNPGDSNADTKGHEKFDKFLGSKREPPPAYLDGQRKISPAEYEISIKNATRPYLLSLAESYDPLWIALEDVQSRTHEQSHRESGNLDNQIFKTQSIPLYSIVNGFYINKTGDYTLRIEYQPQKWFTQGAVISIISAISIFFAYVIFGHLDKIITIFKFHIRVHAKKG